MKLLLIAAAMLLALPAFSTTRYLNLNTGNDAAAGTSPASAWRTWQFAVNHVSGGDTLAVVNGTYTDKMTYMDKPVFPDFPIANPLVIRAQTSGGAIFVGGAGNGEGLPLDGLQGYVFDGFEIRHSTSNVVHIQNSAYITIKNCKIHDAIPGGDGDVVKINQCHHIRFEGCEIYDPSPRSATPEFYQECFDIVDADDSVLKNCWVYHTGSRGTILAYCKGGTHRNVFEGCVFGPQSTASDQPAVLFGGHTDTNLFDPGEHYESEKFVMRNNIFWLCRWGAVGFYDAKLSYLFNNLFVNCGGRVKEPTFFSQNEISQGIMEFRAGNADLEETRTVYVRNNIFMDTEGNMPTILHNQGCHAVFGFVQSHNLFWNAGKAIPLSGFFKPSSGTGVKFQQNPLISFNPASFTSYQNIVNAFSIANNSPIWNAGFNALASPLPGVTKDILGNSRNFGTATDIGPWERQSAAVLPTNTVLCSPNLVLNPVKDANADAWEPTQNFGADQRLQMYGGYEGFHTGEGAGRRTPALQFNLTAIPPGSTIHSATLVLTVDNLSGAESSNGCVLPENVGTIWVEALTSAWDEGTGTRNAPTENGIGWTRRTASQNWLHPGGDCDTSDFLLRYCTIFPASHPTFKPTDKFDVTHLVNRWVNGGLPNNGLMLRALNGGKWYWSREAAAAKRPKLEICYTAPAAASSSRNELIDNELPEIADGFSVFPNPSNGAFFWQNVEEFSPGTTLRVFDLTGKTTRVFNIENQSEGGFDLSGLASGVWFFEVLSGEGVSLAAGRWVRI